MTMVGNWRWAVALSGSLMTMSAASAVLGQEAEKSPGKSERNAARESYNKGTAAYDSGDYVTALDAFVQANALIPSSQAMFWIARCQDQLGKNEAALEVYEQLVGRADFSKLSEDKQATARDRLATLKASRAAAAAPAPAPAATAATAAGATAAAQPPSEAPAPAPAAAAPAPLPPPAAAPLSREQMFLPKENMVEAGLIGGALWLSKRHNLAAPGKEAYRIEYPILQVGLRAGFFPSRYLGVEAEWTHGWGKVRATDDMTGTSADRDVRTDLARAHLVGQWPNYFVVPFVQLGSGFIHGMSGVSGADLDFLFDVGVGAKVMAHEFLVPRIDARMNFSQERGGGMTDGIAASPELLLAVDFILDK